MKFEVRNVQKVCENQWYVLFSPNPANIHLVMTHQFHQLKRTYCYSLFTTPFSLSSNSLALSLSTKNMSANRQTKISLIETGDSASKVVSMSINFQQKNFSSLKKLIEL